MQNSDCNVADSHGRLLLLRDLKACFSTSDNEGPLFRKMEECNRRYLLVFYILASSRLAHLR